MTLKDNCQKNTHALADKLFEVKNEISDAFKHYSEK